MQLLVPVYPYHPTASCRLSPRLSQAVSHQYRYRFPACHAQSVQETRPLESQFLQNRSSLDSARRVGSNVLYFSRWQALKLQFRLPSQPEAQAREGFTLIDERSSCPMPLCDTARCWNLPSAGEESIMARWRRMIRYAIAQGVRRPWSRSGRQHIEPTR